MYLHSPNDDHVEIPRVGLTVERLEDREAEGEVVTHGAEDSPNRRHLKRLKKRRNNGEGEGSGSGRRRRRALVSTTVYVTETLCNRS